MDLKSSKSAVNPFSTVESPEFLSGMFLMTMKAALAALALFTVSLWSGRAFAQQPEPIAENLLRLDGTDQESGIHYQKLILLLKSPSDPSHATPDTLPRFTMECREHAGKRTLHWLIRFTGSPDFAFQRPKVLSANDPGSVPNPSTNLKMRFEGYTRSEEFKRQWEVLPTGELHYRNPGFGSSNLDDPRHFLQWLKSLPNLRISSTKSGSGQAGELFFSMNSLLNEMTKSNFCEP
jgi:hypothetical protein